MIGTKYKYIIARNAIEEGKCLRSKTKYMKKKKKKR